jgi:hypothetical protein
VAEGERALYTLTLVGNDDNDAAFSGRLFWSFAPMIRDPEHAIPDARTDPDQTSLGDTDPVTIKVIAHEYSIQAILRGCTGVIYRVPAGFIVRLV